MLAAAIALRSFHPRLICASMLAGAAFGLYPILLPASTAASYSLTIYNARTGDYSLRVGLIWWIAGMILALAYFMFLYTAFGGKVPTVRFERRGLNND